MKINQSSLLLFVFVALLCLSGYSNAQNWSGILNPTRAIDWSQAGVPGGIPSGTWTQSGSTISAATYGNGSSDATAGIQTALNACGTNHFVLLGPGVFRINTHLTIPNNCVLRGSGPASTQLNIFGSDSSSIYFANGLDGVNPPFSNSSVSFSGGSQGATTITVSSASGITTGSLLMITQPNLSYMTEVGHGGTCSFCNTTFTHDADSGEIVRVTNVAGTTLTIEPPLYIGYANPSYVFPFTKTVATNSGLEYLKISQNNTHGNANTATITLQGAYASWVLGVESDFADNAHMFLQYDLHCEIRDSFFHDAYQHGPGSNDQQLNVAYKTSASLIINNIFWRLHASIMNERGDAGNVEAYNYAVGNYNSSPSAWQEPNIDTHGAHPMMNLVEGNVADMLLWDDYWGSSSHFTLFRNYTAGSSSYLLPQDARGALTGSPIFEDGGNDFAVDLNDLNDYYNLVGNITGSAHTKSLSYVGTKIDPASGSSNQVCLRIGYDGSDNATVGTNTVYPTTFIHGMYDCQLGTFTWDSGHPNHTLPASFFLNAKPAWFGSVPWPPIGPDVTGGTVDPGGYVNAIPAQLCFNSATSHGTTNTGSFDPTACYAQSTSSVLPPTNLSVTVN